VQEPIIGEVFGIRYSQPTPGTETSNTLVPNVEILSFDLFVVYISQVLTKEEREYLLELG
jgi:hypothetical protein